MATPESGSDPLPSKLGARRIDAARYLLGPHQVRESLMLSRQSWVRVALLAGLQAALTALIALPLIHVSSWSHLIGFASLGTLVALFGRFAPRGRRGRIVILCAFWQTFAVFAMSTTAWFGAPTPLQILLLALSCGLFFFVSATGRFGPPGALIFIFAASASMGHVASFGQVLERTAATGVVAALGWLICMLTERFRHEGSPDSPLPSDPVRPFDHRLIAAARIVIAAAMAASAANAVGAAHPGWAAMGAVAVMQGAHLHISINRALQRVIGTVLGAFLVWLILIQGPSSWTVIALLVGLMVATEVAIGANYGLGQILVTPMALLMVYLSAPGGVGIGMAPERVLDTLIGASLGIVLSILCSTLDDRTHLARHHAARAK